MLEHKKVSDILRRIAGQIFFLTFIAQNMRKLKIMSLNGKIGSEKTCIALCFTQCLCNAAFVS